MLVTCPECGAKISEETNPCSKCGLPHAGKKSKEYNERMLSSYNGKAETSFEKGCIPCPRCGFTGGKWGPQKAEVKASSFSSGYYIEASICCPKCRTLLKRVISNYASSFVPYGFSDSCWHWIT